jgi:phage gpG-like protein
MITSNIYSVKKALDKKLAEVDVGVMKARDEMMARLIQLSQEEIEGERGVVGNKLRYVNGQAKRGAKIYDYKNDPAISGQPPKNRTGNLRRSITGKKAQEGFASYSAVVGPTTVYARAVELGGAPTWINGEHFPYMKPALQKFQREAMAIVRKYLG